MRDVVLGCSKRGMGCVEAEGEEVCLHRVSSVIRVIEEKSMDSYRRASSPAGRLWW